MKLNKKLLIIIGVVVIVVTAAIFLVLQFVQPHKASPPTPAQLQAWQFSVDKITTNLEGNSIIQIQVTLQAPNSKVLAELTARLAQLDDTVIGVLHNLSSQVLLAPNGRKLLKEQLMARINSYLTTGKISAVYIQSLIVQ